MSDLHIVHGDSARGTLGAALGVSASAVHCDRDVLSCGPLLPLGDVEAWNEIRPQYWRAIHEVSRDAPYESLASRLLADARVLRGTQRVRLWLGSTVSEQLLLAWVVALFDHHRLDHSRLRVPEIPEFESASGVRFSAPSISVLNPDQVSRITTWHELSSERLAVFRALWDAITASSPTALLRLVRSELPDDVGRTLVAFLSRYPDSESGLSVWDERILQACREHGPKAVRIVAELIPRPFDDVDWVGDVWLFSRLKALGRETLPSPLLRLSGERSTIRTTEVALTTAGREVLEGRRNHVATNGIDEWIGGVHLSSQHDRVWFRRGRDGLDLDLTSGLPQ